MGALIVYDITKRVTFESVPKWLKELQANAEPDIVVMLVGNKVDMCDDASARQVDREEARSFAVQEGILFEETSAVQSINVRSAFETLMESSGAVIVEIYESTVGVNKQGSVGERLEIEAATRRKTCPC